MGRIKTNFVAAALMLMRKLANICNIYARKKFKKVVIFILLNAIARGNMKDITGLTADF
jgi:hypothetical protein